MDRCPCCERGFEGFYDFPRIYVVGLKRLPLPEIIEGKNYELHRQKRSFFGNKIKPPIPQEAVRLLNKSDTDVRAYMGRVYRKAGFNDEAYYKSAADITDITKAIIRTTDVQNALSALEKFAGKEVRSNEVLKSLEIKIPQFQEFSNFRLCLVEIQEYEQDRLEVGIKKCLVSLIGNKMQ